MTNIRLFFIILICITFINSPPKLYTKNSESDLTISYIYNSIAEMKSDSSLRPGIFVSTLGYYMANDGGSGLYYITTKNENDIEDFGSIHILSNNLVARLLTGNNINVNQFGATPDGTVDCIPFIQNCINYAISSENIKIVTFNGTYYCSKPVQIIGATNLQFEGNNSKIICKSSEEETALFYCEKSSNISFYNFDIYSSTNQTPYIYNLPNNTTQGGVCSNIIAFYLNSCSTYHINSCNFYSCTPFYLLNSDNVQIFSNKMNNSENGIVSFSSSNIFFYDNYISMNNTGIGNSYYHPFYLRDKNINFVIDSCIIESTAYYYDCFHFYSPNNTSNKNEDIIVQNCTVNGNFGNVLRLNTTKNVILRNSYINIDCDKTESTRLLRCTDSSVDSVKIQNCNIQYKNIKKLIENPIGHMHIDIENCNFTIPNNTYSNYFGSPNTTIINCTVNK